MKVCRMEMAAVCDGAEFRISYLFADHFVPSVSALPHQADLVRHYRQIADETYRCHLPANAESEFLLDTDNVTGRKTHESARQHTKLRQQ